jgi:hypothetical protein
MAETTSAVWETASARLDALEIGNALSKQRAGVIKCSLKSPGYCSI